jgi:hypothetical protein
LAMKFLLLMKKDKRSKIPFFFFFFFSLFSLLLFLFIYSFSLYLITSFTQQLPVASRSHLVFSSARPRIPRQPPLTTLPPPPLYRRRISSTRAHARHLAPPQSRACVRRLTPPQPSCARSPQHLRHHPGTRRLGSSAAARPCSSALTAPGGGR